MIPLAALVVSLLFSPARAEPGPPRPEIGTARDAYASGSPIEPPQAEKDAPEDPVLLAFRVQAGPAAGESATRYLDRVRAASLKLGLDEKRSQAALEFYGRKFATGAGSSGASLTPERADAEAKALAGSVQKTERTRAAAQTLAGSFQTSPGAGGFSPGSGSGAMSEADLRRLNDVPGVQLPGSLRGKAPSTMTAPPPTERSFAESLEAGGMGRIQRSMAIPDDGSVGTWADKKALLLSGTGEYLGAKLLKGQTYADLAAGAVDIKSYPHYGYVLAHGLYEDFANVYVDGKAAIQNPSGARWAETGTSVLMAGTNFFGMGAGGAAKNAAKLAAKEAAERVVREGAELAAKEGAERALKEAAERAAKEAVERTEREAAELAAKEAAKLVLERTRPSLGPNPLAKPRGKPLRISPNEKQAVNINAIKGENEAAETLAKKGYDVEQLRAIKGQQHNPDYMIEGKKFDCYTPQKAAAENIVDTIKGKVDRGQAERIVINLRDSDVTLAAIKTQLQRANISKLKEIIVVKGDVVIHL